MPRRSEATIEFDALSIEGGLLPPEWLGRVAALDAGAQSPADYGVKKGLHLRDEITRYWRIAEALWAEFASARNQAGHDAGAVTLAFVRQFLVDVFGFEDLVAAGDRLVEGRRFPIAYEAHGGRIPIVVGPATERLDDSTARHGDGTRRRSAWGALQEYLNASDDVLWGVAANGYRLRLGRDNASLTRPAWIEADLERIFTEERFADFSVLWLTLHASRFGRSDASPEDAPLEAWRAQARERGSRARNQLRTGVEAALLELGQGFLAHAANAELRAQLAAGALTPQEYFNELLRLVYRAIFLLTLEEREILHPADATEEARRLYADGYGLRRLRERAVRRAGYDRHTDLWASLRPVFAALGSPAGEPALGLRGLGGLFGRDQCPHLETAEIENRALLTALFRLAWIREGHALARVNWRDMGPEELGSVYESLLELVPLVSAEGRRFVFAGADESAGNVRKLTGSYYTPDELVQELLDSALEPVVAARLAAQPDQAERVLLSISVIDPACGSGHFLLAAARRLATHLARVRSGGTPGAEEYRHALRDVVTHCIHGVDRNPMALELARMALWLEAYTPDRALGFLDHHLVCGDALLGLLDLGAVKDGIPDDALKPLTGDDREITRTLLKLNRTAKKALAKRRGLEQASLTLGVRTLADAFEELEALGDNAIENVDAKRARYAKIQAEAESSPAALAADLYLGAFLMPKQAMNGESLRTEQEILARFPTTGTLVASLEGAFPATHTLSRVVREACRAARVLNWPIAFPQIFARGGFDIIVGNPPWEVSQFSEEEYFTARAPEIASLAGARRKAAIASLEREQPAIWRNYLSEKYRFESTSASIRANPRFGLTAVGKLNTYPLFAETVYRLLAPDGRAGLVLPTGIATDDSTKAFFGEVAQSGRLASLYDFENRERFFPAVDSRMKFCLLTIGRADLAEFAFFTTRVSQLQDRRRRFTLGAEDFRLINPNTLTCPIFRSEWDAELTKKTYRRVPVLVNELGAGGEGNPWGLAFAQGLFNMTSDSELFEERPAVHSLPLYEAKFIGQFDHRRGSYESRGGERGYRVLPETSVEQYQDPTYTITPFYWVNASEVYNRLGNRWSRRWLLAFKDVTAATNERTVVSTVIPFVGANHKLPLIFFPPEISPGLCAFFLATLNSLTFDFFARQKVGGLSLAFFILKQLPVLPPSRVREQDLAFVVPRVLELTYTAHDMADWARDLGYTGAPFGWDPDRRAVLRAELDAYYAYLYGLTRDELRYILEPTEVMGLDYPSETFRVLKNNEMREFGEYRTQRLVLEAWDRLFGAGTSAPVDTAPMRATVSV